MRERFSEVLEIKRQLHLIDMKPNPTITERKLALSFGTWVLWRLSGVWDPGPMS